MLIVPFISRCLYTLLLVLHKIPLLTRDAIGVKRCEKSTEEGREKYLREAATRIYLSRVAELRLAVNNVYQCRTWEDSILKLELPMLRDFLPCLLYYHGSYKCRLNFYSSNFSQKPHFL